MKTFIKLLIILDIVLSTTVYAIYYECNLPLTLNKGACVPLNQCRPALEDLIKLNKFPQQCKIEQNYVIFVCCPLEGLQQNVTDVNENNLLNSTKNIGTDNAVGAKTKAKCHEYAEYAFETIPNPVLMIGANKTIKVPACSISNELIIGGNYALPREFPHMALLGRRNLKNKTVYQCGGSIISEWYILTAAHCIEGTRPTFVVVGDLDYSTNEDDASPQVLPISEWIVHPKRDSPYHDIALLKLERKIQFNIYARPACLATDSNDAEDKYLAAGWGKISQRGEGTTRLKKVILNYVKTNICKQFYDKKIKYGILDHQMCVGSAFAADTCKNFLRIYTCLATDSNDAEDKYLAAGWGKISQRGESTTRLKKVILNYVKTNICKQFYDKKIKYGILDHQMCVGSAFAADTCKGDSGGPLQKLNGNEFCMYDIVGITSFGIRNCGTPGIPAVYTRVSSYIEWIEDTVWPS